MFWYPSIHDRIFQRIYEGLNVWVSWVGNNNIEQHREYINFKFRGEKAREIRNKIPKRCEKLSNFIVKYFNFTRILFVLFLPHLPLLGSVQAFHEWDMESFRIKLYISHDDPSRVEFSSWHRRKVFNGRKFICGKNVRIYT